MIKPDLLNTLLTHLQTADAGVEGIVGAGHVSQLSHADNLQPGVPGAGPQDVPHRLLAQLLDGLDVLQTNQGLVPFTFILIALVITDTILPCREILPRGTHSAMLQHALLLIHASSASNRFGSNLKLRLGLVRKEIVRS